MAVQETVLKSRRGARGRWSLALLILAAVVVFWWVQSRHTSSLIATVSYTPIAWLTERTILLADPSKNQVFVYDVVEHKTKPWNVPPSIASPLSDDGFRGVSGGSGDTRVAVACAGLSGSAGPSLDLIVFSLNDPTKQARIKGFFGSYEYCFLLGDGTLLGVSSWRNKLALFDRNGRILRSRQYQARFGLPSPSILLPVQGVTRENTLLAFNGAYGAGTLSGVAIPLNLTTPPAPARLSMSDFAKWGMCWPTVSPDGRRLGWIGQYSPSSLEHSLDNALRRIRIYAPSRREVIWTTDTAGKRARLVQIIPGTADSFGWVPGTNRISYIVPHGTRSNSSGPVDIYAVDAGT